MACAAPAAVIADAPGNQPGGTAAIAAIAYAFLLSAVTAIFLIPRGDGDEEGDDDE